MRRMRSVTVAAGFTAALALAACSSEPEPTHNRICVDQETQIRVEDDDCDDDRVGVGPRYMWFYYPVHMSGPPVGARIVASQGTYVKPATATQTVPRSGGFGTYRGSTSGGG